MENFDFSVDDVVFVLNKMGKDTAFAEEAFDKLDRSVINRVTRSEDTTTSKLKAAYAEIERQLSSFDISDNHLDSFLRQDVVLTSRNQDEFKEAIRLVCNITNTPPFDVVEYRDDIVISVNWLGKIEVFGGDLAKSLVVSELVIPCHSLLESATPPAINAYKIVLAANHKKHSEAEVVSGMLSELSSKDISALELEQLMLLKEVLKKSLQSV
ncbi:hypothetical protein DZF79_04145 [Vibrio parahaemolyticus]|nr:hypothetical protein [Vibrio parahaemolyticus]